jgi:hypothetical protein
MRKKGGEMNLNELQNEATKIIFKNFSRQKVE